MRIAHMVALSVALLITACGSDARPSDSGKDDDRRAERDSGERKERDVPQFSEVDQANITDLLTASATAPDGGVGFAAAMTREEREAASACLRRIKPGADRAYSASAQKDSEYSQGRGAYESTSGTERFISDTVTIALTALTEPDRVAALPEFSQRQVGDDVAAMALEELERLSPGANFRSAAPPLRSPAVSRAAFEPIVAQLCGR